MSKLMATCSLTPCPSTIEYDRYGCDDVAQLIALRQTVWSLYIINHKFRFMQVICLCIMEYTGQPDTRLSLCGRRGT